MGHSSEATWSQAAGAVSHAAASTIEALNRAEDTYRDLLEIYQYAGATDEGMAALLFQVTTPDTSMIAKVADLRTAIVALHELWQAMNGGTISATDRESLLRRMS